MLTHSTCVEDRSAETPIPLNEDFVMEELEVHDDDSNGDDSNDDEDSENDSGEEESDNESQTTRASNLFGKDNGVRLQVSLFYII